MGNQHPDRATSIAAERAVIEELTPVLEGELNRHLRQARDWLPHRLAAGTRTTQPARLSHPTTDPEGRHLDRVVVSALVLNLLTEDNLPSYHRIVASVFGVTSAASPVWRSWVDTWTAEESRHSLALRDYLLRMPEGMFSADEYERRRMRVLRTGWHPVDRTPLRFLAYVAIQELATRIAHRNTGRLSGEPVLDRLLIQVAADENLHMLLYRNLVCAALDVAPALMVPALAAELVSFQMPGHTEEQFRQTARAMATVGIYNLQVHHDQVVQPLLRHWQILHRDLPDGAQQARDLIATGTEQLAKAAQHQQDRIHALTAAAGTRDGSTL